ncbi:uncharacterized protein HMPREF1541_08112 [Cyphellophora europaea CBS 101466]|uniref:Protein kinase domain-containing protein n=1 Tax=Cyphellophora europaea (strain CBS 101466) TaxID=1220924 RepID=W2RKV3_CYPE1|nr:uncharacterized protein HMPREF1541_08112 [Cyphellophora europaea CBS 101466]ETN37122.1 hypothetical protein HMPREF1541_08112 [Cyphellophora europaea CBS 101466]
MPREAIISAHLSAMKRSERNITQLRGYKFYPNLSDLSAGTANDRGRLYLRYAPHGSLETVVSRYRAFNTHLPELYLWSVLVDLANAACIMRECPVTWNPVPKKGQAPPNFERSEDVFILHEDFKPGNCFIEADRNRTRRQVKTPYHPTELGDFGMSQPRTADPSNPRLWWGVGTSCWIPPEQLQYGRLWDRKVYNWDGATPPDFDERTNVWSIGKIMWHMMTLRGRLEFPKDFRDERGRITRRQEDYDDEQQFYEFNNHFMRFDDTANKDTSCVHYSLALRHLVYECLRPEITRRPGSAQLLKRARGEMKRCKSQTGAQEPSAVHFDNGSMNDVGLQHKRDAGLRFDHQDESHMQLFAEMFLGHRMGNPDEPRLRPPGDDWAQFERDAQIYESAREERHPPANSLLQELAEGVFRDVKPARQKRARSWVSQDEPDTDLRRRLRDLRTRTRAFASTKPMNLLTHILECEKLDVDVAERVMCWLYKPRSRMQFGWARDATGRRQATAAMRKWQERFDGKRQDRTFRECLYFVSKEAAGVLRVDQAIKTMGVTFHPEEGLQDEQRAGEETQPAAGEEVEPGLSVAEALMRIRELHNEINSLWWAGESEISGCSEQLIVRILRRKKWNVQAAVRHFVDCNMLQRHTHLKMVNDFGMTRQEVDARIRQVQSYMVTRYNRDRDDPIVKDKGRIARVLARECDYSVPAAIFHLVNTGELTIRGHREADAIEAAVDGLIKDVINKPASGPSYGGPRSEPISSSSSSSSAHSRHISNSSESDPGPPPGVGAAGAGATGTNLGNGEIGNASRYPEHRPAYDQMLDILNDMGPVQQKAGTGYDQMLDVLNDMGPIDRDAGTRGKHTSPHAGAAPHQSQSRRPSSARIVQQARYSRGQASMDPSENGPPADENGSMSPVSAEEGDVSWARDDDELQVMDDDYQECAPVTESQAERNRTQLEIARMRSSAQVAKNKTWLTAQLRSKPLVQQSNSFDNIYSDRAVARHSQRSLPATRRAEFEDIWMTGALHPNDEKNAHTQYEERLKRLADEIVIGHWPELREDEERNSREVERWQEEEEEEEEKEAGEGEGKGEGRGSWKDDEEGGQGSALRGERKDKDSTTEAGVRSGGFGIRRCSVPSRWMTRCIAGD